jgi:hypothetical protein
MGGEMPAFQSIPNLLTHIESENPAPKFYTPDILQAALI